MKKLVLETTAPSLKSRGMLQDTASPLELVDSAVAAHAHPHAHEAAE
jgi:hypothetical protein